MSCFPKLCRKKKRKSKSLQNEAIKKLEDTEKMLIKQQEDLEKEIDNCVVIAKKNATSNKRVALRALQRKKHLEKKLERVDNVLTTVELQKDALEDSPTVAAIVLSLKNACDVLKSSNITLDATKVQTLMDDITEQYSANDEISNVIRNSIVLDINEDELLSELENLEVDEINTKLLQVPDTTKSPAILEELYKDDTSEFKKRTKPKGENSRNESAGSCAS